MNNAFKIMGVLVLTCIVAGSRNANGEIIMTISDDGSDLTMSATGTYDLSGLGAEVGTIRMGRNAIVGTTKGTFGWDTETELGSKEYFIEFFGILTGTGSTDPAASTTGTTPFFVYMPTGMLSFPFDAPQSGIVNQTAIFTGVTLASLGMVPGEEVVGFWGENNIILIQTIPEPVSTGLIGLLIGCLSLSRRICVGSKPPKVTRDGKPL
jgi:hypothetical protein